MKSSLRLLPFLAALFLIGCASGPKFTEVAPTLDKLAPDKGRIYMYRYSALGAAIRPDVKLNGEVVGKAISHGFFYVDRAPGNYEILTSTEVDRRLSLTLESGQTRYVKLNISIGFFVGHVYPELVDPEVGAKEIQECSYAPNTPPAAK